MAKSRQIETCSGASKVSGSSAERSAIEIVPIKKLRRSRRTARYHSKMQIKQIAESIASFGFINPIVADTLNRVVAGFGRIAAAESLGFRAVPVIRVRDLSETEIRAYMLADNKLAENAGWDRALLVVELQELEVALPEIGLDLSITGFEQNEIDTLFADFDDGSTPEDQIPSLERQIVARRGDLFVLGGNRLLAGDARSPEDYTNLMGGKLAEMAFLDPPYSVRITGHVGGRGRTKHREFICASGEMSSDEYRAFLQQTLSLCVASSIDGAIHYVCMDWRHSLELQLAARAVYDETKNICVWIKGNVGQGSFYRSQHELVFVFKHGRAQHLNNFGLGENGRTRSNVWEYSGLNSFRAGRMDDLSMHPTVKPLALVVDAMRDCSRRGSVVLDAFAGSGTTIIAAEKIGRRAYCLELDAAYVDVAIRRWQNLTKKEAILQGTGQTFDELAATRVFARN